MASKDITMVDSGFWGGFDNGGYDGEESYENLLNILDFPMESLEGDGLAEDWDAKFQCLGPIPSDEVFRGLPQVPHVGVGNGTPPPVLNARTSQSNQQPTFVEVSSTNIPLDSSDCNESGVFQAPSPISVLESSSSSSAGKSISLGAEIAIPVRSRSKRIRRPTCNPWFVMTPLSSSGKDSQPRKNKEKKRKRLSQIRAPKGLEESATQQRSTSATKKCTHCEITKTPQWREGPMGPKTLCNACGVRYRSGRLFPEYRPAASPTFVPSLHSNSHRKVIEMRKKVSTPEETVNAEVEPPMSPPPEFVPMSSYLFDHI